MTHVDKAVLGLEAISPIIEEQLMHAQEIAQLYRARYLLHGNEADKYLTDVYHGVLDILYDRFLRKQEV